MIRDHACFLPEEVWSEDRDQVPRHGQETIRSRNIRQPTQLRRSTTCDTQRTVSACLYFVKEILPFLEIKTYILKVA